MSFKDSCHPIFQYTVEEKEEIWKELGLKKSVIEEDVDMILEWFEKQPHLVAAGLPDRGFLERMLIQSKGSREKAKQRLDMCYRTRSLLPELVQNRMEFIESNDKLWTFYKHMMVPQLFELKRVTFLQIDDPDPDHCDVEVMLKISLMLLDMRMRYDYMLGDIWVMDLTRTSLGHLMKVNPILFAKTCRMFMEGYGVRIFAVHIIGAPSYAAQLHQFFSKFVKPKLMERAIFHDTADGLHKYFPKEYLPKEYGGNQPSFASAKAQLMEILKSDETKMFLEENSKQISDETKRPRDFICEDYLPGTFKKLELD